MAASSFEDEITRPDATSRLIALGMAAEREFHDAEQRHRTLNPEAGRFLSADYEPGTCVA